MLRAFGASNKMVAIRLPDRSGPNRICGMCVAGQLNPDEQQAKLFPVRVRGATAEPVLALPFHARSRASWMAT
jgi:hypothetical protein